MVRKGWIATAKQWQTTTSAGLNPSGVFTNRSVGLEDACESIDVVSHRSDQSSPLDNHQRFWQRPLQPRVNGTLVVSDQVYSSGRQTARLNAGWPTVALRPALDDDKRIETKTLPTLPVRPQWLQSDQVVARAAQIFGGMAIYQPQLFGCLA